MDFSNAVSGISLLPPFINLLRDLRTSDSVQLRHNSMGETGSWIFCRPDER